MYISLDGSGALVEPSVPSRVDPIDAQEVAGLSEPLEHGDPAKE